MTGWTIQQFTGSTITVESRHRLRAFSPAAAITTVSSTSAHGDFSTSSIMCSTRDDDSAARSPVHTVLSPSVSSPVGCDSATPPTREPTGACAHCLAGPRTAKVSADWTRRG